MCIFLEKDISKYSVHTISEFSKFIKKEIKFYHRESSANPNSEIMG